MPDVFVSYAWADNREIEAVRHVAPYPIDRFLEIYAFELGLTPDEVSLKFFRDERAIEPGQSIPDRVANAIRECPVMLAFYSPNYFRSQHCLAEWELFDKERAKAGRIDGEERMRLIPIELRAVDAKLDRHLSSPVFHAWYADVAGENGRKRAIDSAALLDPKDTAPLAGAIRKLGRSIETHIARRQGTSLERQNNPNVLPLETPIQGATLKTPEMSAELERKGGDRLRHSKIPPVCVIYAGGTVGMVRTMDSDPVHADYEMAASVERIVQPLETNLSTLPFDMHFFRLAEPIDSSNVRAHQWVELATLLKEQMPNYQGFVILHGTNTLAYSASALSFLLHDSISKPVVLTGSEVPLSNHNTDAVHNVENAIRATAHQAYGGPILIPEVCVYWNNNLFRGNRVTKKIASDRSSSFHTPNMAVPLATLANDKLDVEYAHINPLPRSDPGVPSRIHDLSSADVAILFIHPDMDFDQIDSQFTRCPDGLILLSYGPGNVPDAERFIAMVKRLIDGGTLVANVTQCPYGRVELKLFETSAALFDLGVIDGYDMTLEAAYTKLLWAISRHPRSTRSQRGIQESMKALFQLDVCGEMSASVFSVHWPRNAFTQVESLPYLVSDMGVFQRRFSRLDIAEAFIRIEGLTFPAGVAREKVHIFYGNPPTSGDPTTWDNLLADFTTSPAITEGRRETDKNLEVRHTFRKSFTESDFQISIGLAGTPGIEFKSLRLVVYTKGTRRREGW